MNLEKNTDEVLQFALAIAGIFGIVGMLNKFFPMGNNNLQTI